MVTNSLSILAKCDRIFMMSNIGTICEIGTFDELKAKQGQFSEFIQSMVEKDNENEEEKSKMLFLSLNNLNLNNLYSN